ncbi:MAG: bifunctional folylpolyglutamate synthase/dihydrofolate synthase [Armatimonadota bacterium]|nr:MAG: bifunctional folylpolyglutamate synthase/dihydrofolate synthase [Armatimonadota bacterium]
MRYERAVEYLESLVDWERLAGERTWNLDRMRFMLDRVGHPERGLKTIHLAGTKGKGSTAAMIASALAAAGLRTGLYTSPHLRSFRERIRINGREISRGDVAGLVSRARPIIQAVPEDTLGVPSFFEAYTLMAFLHFAEQRCDAVVLETGLGGRLDATNVIDDPLVAVITRIGIDHTLELGSTVPRIAAEKAGIIKQGCTVVSSPQPQSAWRVLIETCRERNATLHGVRVKQASGKPPLMRRLLPDKRKASFILEQLESGPGGHRFNLTGIDADYRDLFCPLLGDHQLYNAATAVAALHLLSKRGMTVPEDAVRRGLARVRWPGRLDVAGKQPWIVLDGAHDEISAKALARAVIELFPHRKLILVLGISRDKDIRAVGTQLCPIADRVVFTASKLPRATAAGELSAALGDLFQNTAIAAAVPEALRVALAEAGEDDLVLVTGSLYIVGEAMEALEIMRRPELARR